MTKKPNWLLRRFNAFCGSTALHGWSYLIQVKQVVSIGGFSIEITVNLEVAYNKKRRTTP